MKKFLVVFLTVITVLALAACGGAGDVVIDTADDAKFDLDVIGGNYKIIYDLSDPNAVSMMSDMINKIQAASGVKLGTLSSSGEAAEYEIQFGLKSGRSESEAIYNEIKNYADSDTGAYAIRAVGNKIVIAASDKEALKVAADRFAAMASSVFVVRSDFNDTAIFKLLSYRRGELQLVTFEEFGSVTELSEITFGEKKVVLKDGKKDYFFASEGKTALPEINVKTKYSATDVEIIPHTEGELRYEIKLTSADGSKEEVYNMSYIETPALDAYDLNTWLIPYWNGCITYHESVMFVGDDGAPLLYSPEEVLSVRSFDLKTEYVEGVDYEIKDGKLYRLAGSKIPSFTWNEFYPTSKETSISGNAFASSKKPFVFFAEGTYFHKNQVFVTYTHQPNSDLFAPTKSAKLHKFVEKLERGEEVNIVFFGDSITAGANASGRANTLPGTPMWTQMVTYALQAKYPSAKVNYINTAVGGKETGWGITELETSVNAHKPDLVVLGFGMNDGGKSVEKFVSNEQKIIDGILAKNPDCEIAVIATMLPHSETTYWKNQNEQEAELADMVKPYANVDIVPMTSVHASILTQKRYFDMTGNNVNHPNDFLIRVYAQTILETLLGEN
jgi:lysophospholipase L1-like esterase